METGGEQVRRDLKRLAETRSRSFLNRVRRFESFRGRKIDQLNDSIWVSIEPNCPSSWPSFRMDLRIELPILPRTRTSVTRSNAAAVDQRWRRRTDSAAALQRGSAQPPRVTNRARVVPVFAGLGRPGWWQMFNGATSWIPMTRLSVRLKMAPKTARRRDLVRPGRSH